MHELDGRLRADLRKAGDFSRIHPLPQSGQDVPDDLDARLVVLGIDHPYSKEPDSSAEVAAKAILESRGNTPRLYRNTLVFLAVDKTRLQDLDEAVRHYLAWESILGEKEILNLDPQQVKQAETQKTSRRQRGYGSNPRSVPMASRAGATGSKISHQMGGLPLDRAESTGGAGKQEAEK